MTLNYTYKIKKDKKIVQRLSTHSLRVFLRELRTINFLQSSIEVYVRVFYGNSLCNRGCVCPSYNDGWYTRQKDLDFALQAFRGEII